MCCKCGQKNLIRSDSAAIRTGARDRRALAETYNVEVSKKKKTRTESMEESRDYQVAHAPI